MIRPSKSPVPSGILNIAILVGVVAVLYVAREILIPLAFAVTLSLILAPAVAWLVKLRLGRVPAALLVMAMAMTGTGVVGWVIFTDLVDVANQLPEYRENIHRKLEAIRAPGTGAVGRAAASVKELGKELAAPPATVAPVVPPPAVDRAGRRTAASVPSGPLAVQVVETPGNELLYVRDMIQPFLRPLGVFGMVLIFSLFLMIGHNDLRDRLFRVVGVGQLNVMTLALDDATRRVSKYLLLQLLVNAAFGALCGTGLFLIGVPYAVLWGARRGNSPHRAVCRIAGRRRAAPDSFAGGIRRLDASAAGVPAVRHPGTGHRQLGGTPALWDPYGSLGPGPDSDHRVLDGPVGTGGPDSLDSADRLRRRIRPLRPSVRVSAYPAGR